MSLTVHGTATCLTVHGTATCLTVHGTSTGFIHDRMPLILPEHLVNEWINPDADPVELVKAAVTDVIAEKV